MALGCILARGTGVEVLRAVPEGYAMRGHAAYFKKHWEEFRALAARADAVLTITASWPEDPLYPWARRADIRIVQVDATRPLDGSRAGVPLMEAPGTGAVSPYVWNSPGTFARMADIVAADMARLYPGEARKIEANLRELKQSLFRLRSAFETRFGMLERFEAVALTGQFVSLTDEFGLEVVEYLTAPEYRWTKRDHARLRSALRESGAKAVICAWEPRPEIAATVRECGAAVVVLQPFALDGPWTVGAVTAHFDANLNRLLAALSGPAE
ncbi:metal ABC transporter solute-binding protein, Zn/Mn family [Salidesulfovibrio onnuriiensis]|uniref:metal ABC transporter solute-binding protein, Zn/Mn family n=1 Tax=Salidesulfovibrio onnuriiensis TaxID=2583823 RepID=UPI001650B3CA|nr:zinc ABC transporter substrate-binding protein [Salidesulfovibrio onnuriiensis]